MITKTQIQDTLAKLRVKSGLRGERRRLDKNWEIGMWYDRENSSFILELVYKYKSKKVELSSDMIETRGKSQWMTDNTWRLSKLAIDRHTDGILAAINATESNAIELSRK